MQLCIWDEIFYCWIVRNYNIHFPSDFFQSLVIDFHIIVFDGSSQAEPWNQLYFWFLEEVRTTQSFVLVVKIKLQSWTLLRFNKFSKINSLRLQNEKVL